MNLRGRPSWIATTALAIVVILMLGFLYVRTQTHDAVGYFANVAILRQLKQLDARWELNVLKSRMGIDLNYDSLVDPLTDLNQRLGELQANLAAAGQQDVDEKSGCGALRRDIAEKTRLIEHFKSHNSVLRNSLAFLPTAAEEVEQAMLSADEDAAGRSLSVDLGRILLHTLLYSQAPSDDKAAGIESALKQLHSDTGWLSANVQDALDIFDSHVRAVLREQPEVNGLLDSITQVPTAAHIDAIDNMLSAEQRDGEVRAQRYRKFLLLFAAALAALFLYAAIGLVRSDAVIKRVNKELQRANTTLEDRVQERTRELRVAQSELVTTARQAGMAEIANNVLHNVGNVLNSVNVSAGLIGDRVRDSKVQSLSMAVQLMNEQGEDLGGFFTHDEKGKVLPGYLNKLSAALAAEKETIIGELESLTRSIDHIKEIVATQQSYSGTVSLVEPVHIVDLIEDALRMNSASMARHEITVVKQFADVPLLLLDKHLVLQILVNLIGNAKRAMDGVPDRPHQITLRTDIVELADGLRLTIRVEDDGEGISAENMGRLFVHGFTTRKKGHGFGLHSCALAAKEMGGAITAYSDGPGKGATFTLELPVNPVKRAAA